jgi:hypothetical protein
MKLSVISNKISSLRVFFVGIAGFYIVIYLVLFFGGQELGTHFLHFPLSSVLN